MAFKISIEQNVNHNECHVTRLRARHAENDALRTHPHRAGGIPMSLGQLEKLQRLYLNKNMLSGKCKFHASAA